MLSQPKGREQKESRKKSKSISHPVGVNIENSQQNAYRRKKRSESAIEKTAAERANDPNATSDSFPQISDPKIDFQIPTQLEVNQGSDEGSQAESLSDYLTEKREIERYYDALDESGQRKLSKEALDQITILHATTFSDHIVVCGDIQSIIYFIAPLRAQYLQKEENIWTPIVILESDWTKVQWHRVASFSNVYYLPGNPFCFEDLQRANVTKAQKVVILPKVSGLGIGFHEGNMIDSRTMLIALNIMNTFSYKPDNIVL